MTRNQRAGIVLVGLVLVAVAIMPSGNKGNNTIVDKTNTAEKALAGFMPASEAAFIRTIINARRQYDAGQTEMAKGAARPARKMAICNVLAGVDVTDWVGKISTLSTNNDGRGVLAIAIDDKIWVTTYNNAVSDIGDHTLIDPNSTLYRRALNLQPGQIVRFSGHFSVMIPIAFTRPA